MPKLANTASRKHGLKAVGLKAVKRRILFRSAKIFSASSSLRNCWTLSSRLAGVWNMAWNNECLKVATKQVSYIFSRTYQRHLAGVKVSIKQERVDENFLEKIYQTSKWMNIVLTSPSGGRLELALPILQLLCRRSCSETLTVLVPPAWGPLNDPTNLKRNITIKFKLHLLHFFRSKPITSVLQPTTFAAPPRSCYTPTPAAEEALCRKLLPLTALSHRAKTEPPCKNRGTVQKLIHCAKMEPTEFLPEHFLGITLMSKHDLIQKGVIFYSFICHLEALNIFFTLCFLCFFVPLCSPLS